MGKIMAAKIQPHGQNTRVTKSCSLFLPLMEFSYSRWLSAIALLCITLSACREAVNTPAFASDDLHRWNRELVEVVMEDLFPPMIASRVYTYPQIAAWMASIPADSTREAMASRLHGCTPPPPCPADPVDHSIAAWAAWHHTASRLVFSTHRMQALRDGDTPRLHGTDRRIVERSEAWGIAIAGWILERASRDSYRETRTMARWTPARRDSTWWQTPPDYPAAIEPHWSKIMGFVPVHHTSCTPPLPVPYSHDPRSAFHQLALEAMSHTPGADSLRDATAWYWDDNPNDYENTGHNTRFLHKISPAGHWIRIADYACRTSALTLNQTAQLYAHLAIAQFDAFIACWKVKYDTDRIRPVTYIQAHINPLWMPLIQTPGFPEYTSGHSVISAASAAVLNHYLGEEMAFTDSTEYPFGLGVRHFHSFSQAAEEAGYSRLYGGIHFRDGVEAGLRQGTCIGQSIIRHFQQEQP